MGDPSRLLCRPAVWQAKWADFSARHARQLARLHGSRPRTLANAAADLSAVFAVSSRRSAAALDARFRFRLEKPRTRPMPFQPATASCRPRLAKQPGLLSSMWNLGYPAGLGDRVARVARQPGFPRGLTWRDALCRVQLAPAPRPRRSVALQGRLDRCEKDVDRSVAHVAVQPGLGTVRKRPDPAERTPPATDPLGTSPLGAGRQGIGPLGTGRQGIGRLVTGRERTAPLVTFALGRQGAAPPSAFGLGWRSTAP